MVICPRARRARVSDLESTLREASDLRLRAFRFVRSRTADHPCGSARVFDQGKRARTRIARIHLARGRAQGVGVCVTHPLRANRRVRRDRREMRQA